MGIITYFIKFLCLGSLLTLVIQILLGGIIYIFLAKIFKLECYIYLLETLKTMINGKKR